MAYQSMRLIAMGVLCCLLNVWGPLEEAGADIAGSLEQLNRARHELTIARERAERSLAEHQPGSGHTKQHMQQVLNVLEGTGGKDFSDKAGNPGDGTGALHYITAGKETMGTQPQDPTMTQALAQATLFVEEAIAHAKRSIQGTSVEETHKHAALTAGLLLAADGDDSTGSPVTGSLAYAIKRAKGRGNP